MIQNADPTGDASGDPPELLSLEGTAEPRFIVTLVRLPLQFGDTCPVPNYFTLCKECYI